MGEAILFFIFDVAQRKKIIYVQRIRECFNVTLCLSVRKCIKSNYRVSQRKLYLFLKLEYLKQLITQRNITAEKNKTIYLTLSLQHVFVLRIAQISSRERNFMI